jgi:aminomethyltransferase
MTEQVLKHTPLHAEHVKLGGRMVPFAGWEMPVQYAGISAEHEAVRTRAGLFDVSHMGELELQGEHAAALVNHLVTNDLDRIANGQAMYTCCCNETGTILDDLIIYKRSPTDVLVVCNASNRDKISKHVAAAAPGHCDFRDASDEVALIALQGPRALEVLEKAGTGFAKPVAESLPGFHFAETTVAGIPVTMARTGYTGEDGVELFAPWGKAAELWRALMAAGEGIGIAAAGLGARDTLRLEARLSLYGNDIDETTNPLEAGLGWTVKLDKSDFVGKSALVAIKEKGLERKIVGFEVTGRGIARHGYPLLDREGQKVGICTSGAPGPTVKKNIGLGYLPTRMSEIGTQFQVDCRGKAVDAVVVKTPFYKRPKSG